jgi:hypothetical protein
MILKRGKGRKIILNCVFFSLAIILILIQKFYTWNGIKYLILKNKFQIILI